MASKKRAPRRALVKEFPNLPLDPPTETEAKSNRLKIKLESMQKLRPLTQHQQDFFESYDEGALFIGCFGSAGTGKTMLPVYKALQEVLSFNNPFEQLVIVRTAVQTRDIGYLKGSEEEKVEIFEMPYKEICEKLFKRGDAWSRLKEQGHVRFISTTAIRGITLDNSIIIFDEFQSANWHEINTIMGRIGRNSKIIFCGDYKQNDLIKNKHDESGFHKFVGVTQKMDEKFKAIYYTPDDIVRSSLVKDWIIACEEAGV
jgi:predicted ribonuclease YlaK